MLYNRGYGSVQYRGVEDVMTLEFTSQAPVTAAPVQVTRNIPIPSTAGATPVEVVLTLPPMENGKSEFRVNGVPFWKTTPFLAKLGETQLWTIKNDSDWDHPFHLHGFFFQVIDEKGQLVRPLAWKDTVNIPAFAITPGPGFNGADSRRGGDCSTELPTAAPAAHLAAISVRAVAAIAITPGCFSRRSTEIA